MASREHPAFESILQPASRNPALASLPVPTSSFPLRCNQRCGADAVGLAGAAAGCRNCSAPPSSHEGVSGAESKTSFADPQDAALESAQVSGCTGSCNGYLFAQGLGTNCSIWRVRAANSQAQAQGAGAGAGMGTGMGMGMGMGMDKGYGYAYWYGCVGMDMLCVRNY